jgi:hypothetical protein
MGTAESFLTNTFFVQTLITTLLSGSIVGLVLKAFIDRRMDKARTTREWKDKALALLISPVVMHLGRTSEVADRYQTSSGKKTKSFFDAHLMRDSNLQVRSLLIANGHLLPESLRAHAHRLIAHYDVWIAIFDEKVALEKPHAESMFDIGFVAVAFPVAASEAFTVEYAALREELYGVRA